MAFSFSAALQLEPQKCPFEGVFALSNLAKGSLIRSNGLSIGLCAQSQLRVNCNEDTHKLELQARCSFQDESLGEFLWNLDFGSGCFWEWIVSKYDQEFFRVLWGTILPRAFSTRPWPDCPKSSAWWDVRQRLAKDQSKLCSGRFSFLWWPLLFPQRETGFVWTLTKLDQLRWASQWF